MYNISTSTSNKLTWNLCVEVIDIIQVNVSVRLEIGDEPFNYLMRLE